MENTRLEALLEIYIGNWFQTGKATPVEELCPQEPQLHQALEALIATFHKTDGTLSNPDAPDPHAIEPNPLPSNIWLPGNLIYIEEIGSGAFGRVVKARDPQLDRLVAVKLVKKLSTQQAGDIISEARFLAALSDPAFLSVYGVDVEKGAIITEYVDGFDLLEISDKLSLQQQARLMATLAKALSRAHGKGILHGDIKPGNIKLDRRLQPRLLDFGLAQHMGDQPHGWGTPLYAAPEQFEGGPVDPRTDLYSLGAVFYHMLCGKAPEPGPGGKPELPGILRPNLPHSLQAITLKCLALQPSDRYGSALDLEQDLLRWLDGRDVMAPNAIANNLAQKLSGHLKDIKAWRKAGLIYDHEERMLEDSYGQLSKPLDDWIPQSRFLSFHGIVLYLGVSVLFFGSVCLFHAHHFLEITSGWLYPTLMFGLSSAALSWLAIRLKNARSVSIAYDVAGILIMPLLFLTLFREWGWLTIRQDETRALFPSGIFTNAQLQVAAILVFIQSTRRAWFTQTFALGAVAIGSFCLLHFTLILNRAWVTHLMDGQYHLVGIDLIPLLCVLAIGGHLLEKRDREFLARPAYLAATFLLILILELLALNGKVLEVMGLSSSAPVGAPEAFDPIFFDTMVTLVFNGILLHILARILTRLPSPLLREQSIWLYRLTPFLILEPLALMISKEMYSPFYHWFYLLSSLGILWLSGYLQRKSFYYAGIGNTLMALYYITSHYQWLEHIFWPLTLITTGGLLLFMGNRLYERVSGH